MKNRTILAGLLALLCVGCNVGNAPEPMSQAQLDAHLKTLKPQDEINYINTMPIPAAEKAKKIAEVEARTGYKAPASNRPQTP